MRYRYPCATNRGIASSQSPLDSASALRRKLLSLPCSSFSDAIRFAGFASEAWAAERENDSGAWGRTHQKINPQKMKTVFNFC